MPSTARPLSSADYHLVLAAIRAVGEVSDPEFFDVVMAEQVSRAVRSDITSINDVDPENSFMRSITKPDDWVPPAGVIPALDELIGEHPLISHIASTGDGTARKISDFWSTDVWHASALYQRVYAVMGVEYQMSIALPAPRPAVVGLALNRFKDDFSERDRAVLNLLRPHLVQSWRQAREHARLRAMVDTAAGALAADGAAVVLLTNPVHELTPGALTELYRYFGRPPATTALPHRVQRWLDGERATTSAAGVGHLARPLAASRSGRRLILRYLPAAGGHTDALLLRSSAPTDAPAQLATLGLSGRESEVLSHLTTGATNAEIAAHLNLAPSTVKRHLDHIYLKLGVSGRVQATSVALTALAHRPQA